MHLRSICVVLVFACLNLRAADTVLNPPQFAAGTSMVLNDVAVDSTGAQYIVGTFNTTVDLNPGVGEVSRTPAGGAGDVDAFIIKLNADGGYAWGRTFGGSFPETGDSVVINGGFVYLAGTTPSNNAGFDGATGSSGTGAFLCAFDISNGVAKADFDGDGHAEYSAFSGGGAGPKVTFFGGDLFLAGRDSSGVAQVAKISAASATLDLGFSADGLQTFGGGTTTVTVNGVAADASRVFICGTFSGTGADIGASGAGTINSIGASNDFFLAALNVTNGNADTNFSSDGVETFGGTGNETLDNVSLSDGTIFLAGILNSTDAGFGTAGTISRVGAQPDAVIIALNSTGTPVSSFDSDGVLIISPPVASGANEGSINRVRISAEFGAGVTTPGIAVQLTQNPSNGIPLQVVSADIDGSGAKRFAFGINGEIKIDSNGSEVGVSMVRSNGRTTLAAIGSNSSSIPVIFTNNYIPRVLETRARIVASFASDTGAPLFPHFIDVFPRADDVAGGRIVSVLGANFPGGASVAIADINMTGLTPVSSSKITGAVPAIAATGDKTVALTFANGRVISTPNAFAIGTKAQAAGPVHRGPVNGAFVDSDNNTYFVGTFSGTKDFNPGPGVDMQRSVRNDTSAFVTKTNADGSYGWTSVFVGLGRTTLNSVVVKGNRVYAVGDFQPDTLTGTGQSFAGINGLGNALCKGNGDGALLCLDRATGFAIDTVSNDGIKIVGGSTDTSFTFGTYDALHCIAASPTANVLAVSGRMLSTDVGFDGTGAINANDSAFFFNIDTDCNVTQNVVKDYPLTPPSSSIPSALCTYSPDGSKLTCAAFSGDHIDLYQFSGNVGAPLNTFGTAGAASIDADSTVSGMNLDSTNDTLAFAWTTAAPTVGTVANADGTTGLLASILNIESKPGQTPAGSVSNVTVVFDPVTDDCVVAVVCNGDLTLTSGAATQDLSVERTDQFDNNIVICKGDITNPQALATSAQVIKSDGGGSEDCRGLFSLTDGVGVCASSTPPGTVVRLGTQEATPGEFSGAVFTVTGGGGGDGTPPTITSATTVDIIQGEDFFYTITATGSPTITYQITKKDVPSFPLELFLLDSSVADNFITALTGNQIRIFAPVPGQLELTIKATNSFGSDEKKILFNIAKNPKSPVLTVPLETPLDFNGNTPSIQIPAGSTSVIYTVTGDQPIDVKAKFGESSSTTRVTVPVNASTGSGSVDLQLTPGLFSVILVATNAFGIDIALVKLDARSPENLDADGDGTPDVLDSDDDNDGFPDLIEIEAGSLPNDGTSKPSGITPTDEATPSPKSTSIQLNFSTGDAPADSILDQTNFEDFEANGVILGLSRAAPKPATGTLLYEIGGVVRTFTIDAKGKGVSGNDKVAVKFKNTKGKLSGNVNVSIKKANLKAKLSDEGLTSQDAKKIPITVSSFIVYNGVFMNRTLTLEYSSKLGKKGSAKLKK